MRVLIFGDSITQGFWDLEGGWAGRIRKYYDQQKIKGRHTDPPTIFNLGISGDITKGILMRFDNEVQARKWRWPNEEFAFVFAIGVNDSAVLGETGVSNADNYKNELKELVASASKFSDKILFVGLTPCIEDRANSRKGKKKEYTNLRIKQFDGALQKFCSSERLPYVEVFKKLSAKLATGEELFPDGLHPNDAGHQIMAEAIMPRLEDLLS